MLLVRPPWRYVTVTPLPLSVIFETTAPRTYAVAPDRPGQGARYPVHAADRLEHQHRLVVAELEGEVAADAAGEHLGGGRDVAQEHPGVPAAAGTTS